MDTTDGDFENHLIRAVAKLGASCPLVFIRRHAIIFAHVVDSVADAIEEGCLCPVSVDGNSVLLEVLGVLLEAVFRRVAQVEGPVALFACSTALHGLVATLKRLAIGSNLWVWDRRLSTAVQARERSRGDVARHILL